MPPAAWNCSSATTSSRELIGDQNRSGSAAKTFAHSTSGLVAKICVQFGDQVHGVDGTGAAIGESRIVQPLGVAHRPAQRRPVPVDLQADNPEPSPVACGVIVHTRVRHRLATPDGDRIAGHQIGIQVETHRVGTLPIQRRADQLSFTGSVPRHQCRADGAGQRHTGRMVTHAAPLERRGVARSGEQVGHAGAGPERGDVIGGAVGVRPGLAVAGDQPINEPRVGARQ